jgi:hypothetical protein
VTWRVGAGTPSPDSLGYDVMDEVHIPNDATYAPFSLTDVIAAAPLASRLLLGATFPGRVLSAAALGVYPGSALKDWVCRQDEVARLAARLDEGFTSFLWILEASRSARQRAHPAFG